MTGTGEMSWGIEATKIESEATNMGPTEMEIPKKDGPGIYQPKTGYQVRLRGARVNFQEFRIFNKKIRYA